jgi:hypothetical protein
VALTWDTSHVQFSSVEVLAALVRWFLSLLEWLRSTALEVQNNKYGKADFRCGGQTRPGRKLTGSFGRSQPLAYNKLFFIQMAISPQGPRQ